MIKKIHQQYMELILLAKPSKTWKVVRFFLHWATLPIKLLIIGGMGTYQILRQELKVKVRKPENVEQNLLTERKKEYFTHVMNKLPVLKKDDKELYVNRVPYWDQPQPWNYNCDHQAARHGVYCFLMGKLDKRNANMDRAMTQHVRQGQLIRGYKLNPYDKELVYNQGTVSGDMLVGFCLGMMNLRKEKVEEGKYLDGTTGFLKEKFDEMLFNIVENDYALLEGTRPENGDVGQPLWDKLLTNNEKIMPSLQKKMKSERGMWQPGLETVGAQALTILAALRVGDKIIGASYAKKEYRRLLFRYGYGLLSLFPTAFTQTRRGYFNDHNCITCLYILSKLSDSKLGKLFWKISMLYVWMLSRKQYNGYFTGLLEDAHPGTVGANYLNKCANFLYEEKPVTYSYAESAEAESTNLPVKFNEMNQGEFYPDMEHKLLIPEGTDPELKRQALSGVEKYRSGLGWLACAILLEKDPKVLLND